VSAEYKYERARESLGKIGRKKVYHDKTDWKFMKHETREHGRERSIKSTIPPRERGNDVSGDVFDRNSRQTKKSKTR